MADPASDDVARNRWLAINAVRIAGAAVVVFGLLGVRGVIDYPAIAGYVFVGAGLLGIFAAPLALARKWRSPPE